VGERQHPDAVQRPCGSAEVVNWGVTDTAQPDHRLPRQQRALRVGQPLLGLGSAGDAQRQPGGIRGLLEVECLAGGECGGYLRVIGWDIEESTPLRGQVRIDTRGHVGAGVGGA